MKSFRLHTLLLALAVAACQPDMILPTEEVGPVIDNEVQAYVDRFVAEGTKRGVSLDISRLVIQVQGEIQPQNAAGACHYFSENNTPHIVIDTTSFNWKHKDHTREMLVFHELAHCLLGRRHENQKLPNGNYASMMRSDRGVLYGPDSYKRSYYLDELFELNPAIPSWAKAREEAFVTPGPKTPIFEDRFEDNQQQWNVGNSSQSLRTIEAGTFNIQSLGKGAIFTGKRIPLPAEANFEVDLHIQITQGNRPVLLHWGGEAPESMYYFGYGKEKFAMIGHTEQGMLSGRTVEDLLPTGINQLKIIKKEHTYTFFINGLQFDSTQLPPFSSDLWGFYVGSYSQIELSHFSIHSF